MGRWSARKKVADVTGDDILAMTILGKRPEKLEL
jgi:hypothetical protein